MLETHAYYNPEKHGCSSSSATTFHGLFRPLSSVPRVLGKFGVVVLLDHDEQTHLLTDRASDTNTDRVQQLCLL